MLSAAQAAENLLTLLQRPTERWLTATPGYTYLATLGTAAGPDTVFCSEDNEQSVFTLERPVGPHSFLIDGGPSAPIGVLHGFSDRQEQTSILTVITELFTALYKQATPAKKHHISLVYEQLHHLRRHDPFTVPSTVLLELLQCSSKLKLVKKGDQLLLHRQEADAGRFFNIVLHHWALEATNLLHFSLDGSNQTRMHDSISYSVSVQQIASFTELLRPHVNITGLGYDDCFNLLILEKLAQAPSLFSFILIGWQKLKYMASVLQWVDKTLGNRKDAFTRLFVTLSKQRSTAIGVFNQLSYFTKQQARLLQKALRLALHLLPYIMVIHRLSTSYYNLVFSDTEEKLSLDLLPDSFFEGIRQTLCDRSDAAAQSLIAHSLSRDITLAVQHTIGPDHLFVSDILCYRRNLFTAIAFLGKVKRVLPHSQTDHLAKRMSQLDERCQDLLDLTMWQYQYSVAAAALKSGAYSFPPSLLSTLEELTQHIGVLLPKYYSPEDPVPRTNFTYALTLFPAAETVASINIAIQGRNKSYTAPISVLDIPSQFYTHISQSLSLQYPICGCYKPTRPVAEQSRNPAVSNLTEAPATGRSGSKRKRSALRLTIDLTDLQSEVSESDAASDAPSMIEATVAYKQKISFKHNYPKRKLITRSILLAAYFKHNYNTVKASLSRADFSATQGIVIGLQQLCMDLSHTLPSDTDLPATVCPIIPLQLGQHIVAVRTLLERQVIFSSVQPLLAHFLRACNDFLLYVKSTVLKAQFEPVSLTQHNSCMHFIEYHFKQCVLLAYIVSNFGSALLRLLFWKEDESDLFRYVTDEFLASLHSTELLAPLSYTLAYTSDAVHLGSLDGGEVKHLKACSYKNVLDYGQKLPVPEFATFLWLYSRVFDALVTLRGNRYSAWMAALDQAADEVEAVIGSVPIEKKESQSEMVSYHVRSIAPVPDFLQSYHWYMISMKTQTQVEAPAHMSPYSFGLLHDLLLSSSNRGSLQVNACRLQQALLVQGSAVENSSWVLPPIPAHICAPKPHVFNVCRTSNVEYTYKCLASLLDKYIDICLRLKAMKLWTLLKDKSAFIEALLDSYISEDWFVWRNNDAVEQLLLELETTMQVLLSHSNITVALSKKLRDDIHMRILPVDKYIKLPITQPLAPISEFLLLSRSWSTDRLPEQILVSIINDSLVNMHDSTEATGYFLPNLIKSIEYCDFLSFGSVVLSCPSLLPEGTAGGDANSHISLFVHVCSTIEESIYSCKKALKAQLTAYLKDMELLNNSSGTPSDFFFCFLEDFSIMLYEVTTIWLVYLYLLCSPKTSPILHVVTKVDGETLAISPMLGSTPEAFQAISVLLRTLPAWNPDTSSACPPNVINLYTWAEKLVKVSPVSLDALPDPSSLSSSIAAGFQTITGRVAMWISSILQIPMLIETVVNHFPDMADSMGRLYAKQTGSAEFEREYSTLSQFLPLHLLLSSSEIVHFYRFDGLLFYIARLLLSNLVQGHAQLDSIRSTISASTEQLLKLKRSENITTVSLDMPWGNPLFVESLLGSLQDTLRVQNLIEHIPSTEQFNCFFAEFVRFKSFIADKEYQFGVVTCGLYLLRNTDLAEPLIRRASAIVKDLSAPILANLSTILELYYQALQGVDKECYLYLKHAMGQVDDSRSLMIEYRYYPIISNILDPAALIRTVHLLRSIFKIDCLNKLYEQITNKTQVLVLYMQKNGINIESTFKGSIEKILELRRTVKISYEKIKYLVDSTRFSLLSYTIAANKIILSSLHECLNFLKHDWQDALDPQLKHCIEDRILTASDLLLLYTTSSQALLSLEDSSVRIRHMYAKMCYHYELCYLQGLFGANVFVKSPQSLFEFTLECIKATGFVDNLKLITAYQNIWEQLCRNTGMLLTYVDKPLSTFYRDSAHILAQIRSGCSMHRPAGINNCLITDLWSWYTSIMHIIQETFLSIVSLREFSSEQWKDLIYQVRYTRQDLSTSQVVNITEMVGEMFTLRDVLILKLNAHQDILVGKLSMAHVNSIVMDRVKGALLHWSNSKGSTFAELVCEIADLLMSQRASLYLTPDPPRPAQERCLQIVDYFSAHDTLSFAILQHSLELEVRRLVKYTTAPLQHLRLLLTHLDLLSTVADMKYSERSFPALTTCQIYLRTLLDMGAQMAEVAWGVTQMCNFLMMCSYTECGNGDAAAPITTWRDKEGAQDLLRVFIRLTTVYAKILQHIHEAEDVKSLLLAQCPSVTLVEVELIGFSLKKDQPDLQFSASLAEAFSKKFQMLLESISQSISYTKLDNFNINLYDSTAQPWLSSQSTEGTEDRCIRSGLELSSGIPIAVSVSESGTLPVQPGVLTVFPLVTFAVSALKVIKCAVLTLLEDHVPAIPIRDKSELAHGARYVVRCIQDNITPRILFDMFAEGPVPRISVDMVLSPSGIVHLTESLVSGVICYSQAHSSEHLHFLYSLTPDGNDMDGELEILNCSLFQNVLCSHYAKRLLTHIFPQYTGFILSTEKPGTIVGYTCATPNAHAFIFYQSIRLASTRCDDLSFVGIDQAHPLWRIITLIFHCYEQTLRIGALLTLRELRTIFSLSFSVDMSTAPGMAEESSVLTVSLLYGAWETHGHYYDPVPLQAICLGVRMFVSSLLVFQYDYAQKTETAFATSNDFLTYMLTSLREYTGTLHELPLSVLVAQTEDRGQYLVSPLEDLPRMTWKVATLYHLLEQFRRQLVKAEASLKASQERAVSTRRIVTDPDHMAKLLFQELVSDGVLVLQMEFNVYVTRVTSFLGSVGVSFNVSRTTPKDTLYSICISTGEVKVRPVLYAELARRGVSNMDVDSIMAFSPTLTVTRSYIRELFESETYVSMAPYTHKLLSSVRASFQNTFFVQFGRAKKEMPMLPQTVEIISTMVDMTYCTELQQHSGTLRDLKKYITADTHVGFTLFSVDAAWEAVQEGTLSVESNVTEPNRLEHQKSLLERVNASCTAVATAMKNSPGLQLTCKSLERALAKYLHSVFTGQTIVVDEQMVYLALNDLLCNIPLLSLDATGLRMDRLLALYGVKFTEFALHAHDILQQMMSLDLDDRLLQCMDPLVEWMLQKVMTLRYMLLLSYMRPVVVLHGPVFSYVHLFPWILYRSLQSIGLLVYYQIITDTTNGDNRKGIGEVEESIGICTQRLEESQSIDELLSEAKQYKYCYSVVVITAEALTAEHRSYCIDHKIPIITTARPINDAYDFKHLEMLTIFTNIHAWRSPSDPKITGAWYSNVPHPLTQSHSSVSQSDDSSPQQQLESMYQSLSYQRWCLAPHIAYSFISLSSVYIDLVEKAVTSQDECAKYRFHAISSALSIILAILDVLLLDRLLCPKVLQLGTGYFNTLVIFACSWAYAALPIKTHQDSDRAVAVHAAESKRNAHFVYIDTSVPRYSPFLLRAVTHSVQSRQHILEPTRISWPVFLSNALGSLVLSKISCKAPNIYSFVPVLSIQKSLIGDVMNIAGVKLLHNSWPEFKNVPPAIVPQIIIALCQLCSAGRLFVSEKSLSATEYFLLITYLSHFYSTGTQSLPMHRCLSFLSSVFVTTNQEFTNASLTRGYGADHRLMPLHVSYGISYPSEQSLMHRLQLRPAEFCPLIMTSVPVFASASVTTCSVYSYTMGQSQMLYISDYHLPVNLKQRLNFSEFLLLTRDLYVNVNKIDTRLIFAIPRINVSLQTLAYQLFQPCIERLRIPDAEEVYTLLIQITLHCIQEYHNHIDIPNQLDALLAVLSNVQSLLEGFAYNEKLTRQACKSLTREDLCGPEESLLTPKVVITAWILTMINLYMSQFAKAFYDSPRRFSVTNFRDFCTNLFTLASTKGQRYSSSEDDQFALYSVKQFATMELLAFYNLYPLFAVILNHNNLFLPIRLRHLEAFAIRQSANTLQGVVSGFTRQLEHVDYNMREPVVLANDAAFLRQLSLTTHKSFSVVNNSSLPVYSLCTASRDDEHDKTEQSKAIGLICTRALQCFNFTILRDLFATVYKTLHSSVETPELDEGYYTILSDLSMPAFQTGIVLQWLSLFPIAQTPGITSTLVNLRLRQSFFILTDPGFSLKNTLAFACNMRGIPYPLVVLGSGGTTTEVLTELAHALAKGYLLAAYTRKPVCLYISPYAIRDVAILEELIPLLKYGYSASIVGMLSDLEQYTLARRLLCLLLDSSYNPLTLDNPVFKDFSLLVDGPLERVKTVNISSDKEQLLARVLSTSGIKRFLSVVALEHFGIHPSPQSAHGQAQGQKPSNLSRMKVKYKTEADIRTLRTLTDVLCSPMDVLTMHGTSVSLSSLLHIFPDVPMYSRNHELLRSAKYSHIYTSSLVTALPPMIELSFVEEMVSKELMNSVPDILQDILVEQHCMKLGQVYRYVLRYLAEEIDMRLLLYYASYPSCIEFARVLKSLLFHRKHTFTVRYKHYDLALTNLQLVHENSEQALDRCRRTSAEIQAHSLALQNTSFELSHIEEETLFVKQQLCVKISDKKYAEQLLKDALGQEKEYKQQVLVFHKQMDKIIAYQNSVNPILFAAGWHTGKRFQECLSLACLHLIACTSKKVSVFALSVPAKGGSKPNQKTQVFSVEAFKGKVSNIDLFLKEMVAPSPEEIVRSPHYQNIKTYTLDAIASISGYKHTAPSFVVPVEQLRANLDFGKEVSRMLPPFYPKEKARYCPATIELLKASIEIRNIHVLAELLLWLLLFQLELSSLWVTGSAHRNAIIEQTDAIAAYESGIGGLERQLASLDTKLALNTEKKASLTTELEHLRKNYADSKDILSTTSNILNNISDLKQAWLGTRADMKSKLEHLVGDSVILAVAYTMLLHVRTPVRCRYLVRVANMMVDMYGYSISTTWEDTGLSDGSITRMTLCSSELMQIQYAALTSHLFSPQTPLYEKDINITLSDTRVEASGDLNISDDDWVSLINCFGSLSEIEGDILRHGSVLIDESIVFYITALLFGQRNAAILVTESTRCQGSLLVEIISKLSMFYSVSNGCIRPVFLHSLAECNKLYSNISFSSLTSTAVLQEHVNKCTAAIADVSSTLHVNIPAPTSTVDTLLGSKIVLPTLVDLEKIHPTALEDVFAGAYNYRESETDTVYSYLIDRKSATCASRNGRDSPTIVTSRHPLRLFVTVPSNGDLPSTVISNNHLLSFCSIIDLESFGYTLQSTEAHSAPSTAINTAHATASAAAELIVQHPKTDFIRLDYTETITAQEKPTLATTALNPGLIYQEITRYGYVLANIDVSIVDFMCSLQSNADHLNILTSNMLHLVLSDDKTPFLEAIAQVHHQMKLVTAMVIRLKKRIFVNVKLHNK